MAGTSPTSRSFGVTCGFFYVKEPLLTGSRPCRAAIRMSTSNIVGLSRDCAIPHACRERFSVCPFTARSHAKPGWKAGASAFRAF